jgi:ADP-dependent phosphofructokinase/glucokinase
MNVLCGYNVNIDSIYRISGAEVSELLETFEETEILKKIEKLPEKILSKSDFVAGLAYCMKNGCGAEWLVLEQSVFEFLKNRYFEKSLVRMGGNAGIMANALSQLGVSRVIPNIAMPSKIQLSLFSGNAIYFPASEENCAEKNDFTENKYVVSSIQDPIHFVFDFSRGDTFLLCGTEVLVPRENRFIATSDHLNLRLYVNPAFEKYALEHACELDGAIISGFHLLLESYPDGSNYKTILEERLYQIKRWKGENEKLQIHLELGHFASKKIAASVFQEFAAFSDSIGMNEDELVTLGHFHGVPGEKISRMEAGAVGNAAYRLASQHGLKKIIIHTREFTLTAFKPNFNSILQEMARRKLEAMKFGINCAGVYAASGRLEGREFVEKEASKLQESSIGKKQLESFLQVFNGQALGQGAYAFNGEYIICMLPTLLSKFPVTTVGLGDTLTAGIFLRELELDV